jgi:hypothetical protein
MVVFTGHGHLETVGTNVHVSLGYHLVCGANKRPGNQEFSGVSRLCLSTAVGGDATQLSPSRVTDAAGFRQNGVALFFR